MAIQIDKSITSKQNPVFRSFVECLTSKGIRKHQQFIVSGEKAVRDTLSHSPELARSLLLCADRHLHAPQTSTATHPYRDLATTARVGAAAKASETEARFSVIALTPELFEELDTFGTHEPLLVMRTPEIPVADLLSPPLGLEILCALGDPANVGSLFRTATAFGASRIVLLKESASPFHPKAVRAASATTLVTSIVQGPSIRELSPHNVSGKLIALDMKGERLESFPWPRDIRILMGEEGPGLPDSPVFQRVTIPITEGAESLNATIASSIAIYSYRLAHPIEESC